ncbi:stabilizer of axonemal microtubules 2 isoform X2 [Nematostella vectensis]|uniref:stabilizer of axonemal microtubules 2 isoform X2 n=1 Tax=Nematostella vectensis TaxID=45351 RepID=UPI0020772906|nr:stabilizer of axonemal microtubules 2 isoform X2 [Nematostella vectensis]
MVQPLCICQICTCGRHRCAHRPETRGPTHKCLFTEYQDRYKDHPFGERTKPIKPDRSVRISDAPLEDRTHYRLDYISHKYAPPKKREKDRWIKPDGRVEDESTYKHDYPGRMVAPAESAKPACTYQPHDKPFQGSTVHQDTFRPWDLNLSRVKSMKPDTQSMARDGRMDGRTIHQTDFPGHSVPRRPAIRPPNSDLRANSGPMENDTTTRLDYTKKQILPAQSAKPVYRRPSTGPPFQGITTCQHDFGYKTGRPAASFKPQQGAQQSNAPFEDSTTTRESYPKWAIPKRQMREKEAYRPPSGKFKDDTTFRHDYPEWNVGPAQSARPPVQSFASNQPFQDSTTHSDTYKKWAVQAVPKSTKPEGYRPPSRKFEGESTMQSHFRGQYGPRSKPVRQEMNRPATSGPMDLHTTYDDTFKGLHPPPCPAATIRQWEKTPQNGGCNFFLPTSKNFEFSVATN